MCSGPRGKALCPCRPLDPGQISLPWTRSWPLRLRSASAPQPLPLLSAGVASPGQHLFEGVEAVLDLDKRLWPLRGWKLVQQLGAPSSHIASGGDVAHHATDDSAVEQKVVAAGCEAVMRIGHQGLKRESSLVNACSTTALP